jgi:hypothetical protein
VSLIIASLLKSRCHAKSASEVNFFLATCGAAPCDLGLYGQRYFPAEKTVGWIPAIRNSNGTN